ncbi:MAG: F0F1 ATP synthase subunit delta, partial [Congregibacter sp.]|nr:F0F1 ATP synthase subunit delta [Congregibacter sp.]
ASTEDALTQWLAELQLVSVVVADAAVKNLLSDPSLTSGKQADVFVALFGDELGDSRKRFLHVLAENRRLGLAPHILTQFAQLKAQREQSVDVEMVSPFEVPEAVRDRIAQALSKRLERDVVVSTSIDSSLLGGVLIRAGDLVIDGSVRGRLNKLAEALTN